LGAALGCGESAPGMPPIVDPPPPPPPPPQGPTQHSSSIAVSSDGRTVYVVNPDADSVSMIDTETRTLIREVLLAPAHPAPDASGAYTPAVMPRALALSSTRGMLYVTGQRAGKLF